MVVIAREKGITVSVPWEQILQEHGNISVEQTYRILITNSVFKESRRTPFAQQQKLVDRHGCVIPTVQEYLALCVFTNKVFQKCLYRAGNGQTPWTYGRSSTHVENYPLIVGGSAPARVDVHDDSFDAEDCGVGGRREL